MTPFRTSGSPPVRRILRTPRRTKAEQMSSSSPKLKPSGANRMRSAMQ
jgi:hypothetical protein